jgi:hypothetical protein
MADDAEAPDEDGGDAGEDATGAEPRRPLLSAFAPEGPVQIAVAVLAVCFLTGAIGYLLGTRSTAPRAARSTSASCST